MDDFLDYLQPTIVICNALGIMYMVNSKIEGTRARIIKYLLPVPFYSCYVYISYTSLFRTHHSIISDTSKVVKINDLLGQITSVTCLLIKGIYYFIGKDSTKEMILKVNCYAFSFFMCSSGQLQKGRTTLGKPNYNKSRIKYNKMCFRVTK